MSNKPALRDHRLKIMEGVLAWEGEIGNARVRKLFGLQPVQASRLLGEFRLLMGNRIIEDGRAKVLKPATPEGIETDISLDEYVRQTQIGEDSNPCIVDARIDLTEVKPVVFALLRKATLNKTGIRISYASMTNPAFEERTIFPHSIIHVGRRWHVRGWCAKRQDFRDFTLGRIKSASPVAEAAPKTIDDDQAWHEVVLIELAAHRKLSIQQQEVVRGENFGGLENRRLPVRACLAQYVIQDLRAAVDPEKEVPPEFQIEITNPGQLKKTLF
ncbi:helix-turn-helix transcriptional regulator [Ferribacterium limneticum]|uniref:helix-turn-helix transcriptional regulator n=1 Tax=Ferribacterium limneticum TaxID=76259 RepID=UPI001CF84D71|nr:WYL domain-containing protein [Ferribacterium limneticum]UCV22197.1 WYL domain-containing protein [Ferribacterium limneticum]